MYISIKIAALSQNRRDPPDKLLYQASVAAVLVAAAGVVPTAIN